MISAYSDGPVSQLFWPILLFFGGSVMGKFVGAVDLFCWGCEA